MKLWNKIAQDQRLIQTLVVSNATQLLIIIGLIISLALIPTRFEFHIPPDLSNGATLHVNKIPKSYVGQFAYNIWQVLNNWSTNGQIDAKKNINVYGAYLTPTFKYSLAKHYKELASKGELEGRVRIIRPINGDNPQVTKMGAGNWQALLKLRESEYVNGVLIKDKEIEYPFKVVRFNGNNQLNPFGLALDGYISKPFVVKTFK